jgi:TolA-binding protein
MNLKISNISLIILLICGLFLLDSCSSVKSKAPFSSSRPTASKRSPSNESAQNNQKSKSNKNFKTSASKNKSNLITNKKNINSDTTTIVVNRATAVESDLRVQYDIAVDEFDNENYKDACEKFSSINETLDQSSPLYYESLFYSVECDLLNEKIASAEKTLLGMLNFKNLPEDVMQKVLVRLGHINCVNGKKTVADQYFTRLKNEYPNSKYLKLANCESVTH